MGLVCSQARLLMLYDRKSSLEFQMQCITGRLMAAAARTSGIALKQSKEFGILASDQSESAKSAAEARLGGLEADLAQINAWEKQMTLMQKQIETQHKAVETEIESVKKVIDKNIDSSFKYFA